ncbi:uncharacterized protein [Paramormyrops kingsleyae]|uniref:uncharacterized protein isoform X2 n=1 Tax=Paramormyrops kingsleyae TaxID=1676925 RepID=UPI003B975F5B
MEHSTGPSGGQAPEVLEFNVDHTNVEMEEKPMAAQDGKRSHITNDSELPRNDTDQAGQAPEVLESNVDHSNLDMEEKPMAAQEGKRPNITNDSELLRTGTDPAGEEGESDNRMNVSTMEYSTGPSGGQAPEVLESNVDHSNLDMEEKPMAAQEGKRPNITNDSELLRTGTDPAGEEGESDNRMNVSTMEYSTGPSGGQAPEVLESNVDHSNLDMEEKPMAAQEGKRPNITNDSELLRTGTDPAGEEGESDNRMNVSTMEYSTGPSGVISRLHKNLKTLRNYSLVKVHVLVAGETFQAHETFIQKLKLQIEQHSVESSNVILVFCPVVSRIGTDMEAAMARVTGNKPVILVFMHHCHHPSHMTNITVQPSRSNIVQAVHCAFHETTGLLECQENEQAVKAVHSQLLRYVDSHDEVPQPKVPRTQPVMVQQLRAAQGANSPNINDSELPGKGTDPAVKVHMLLAGETFQTHETFIQKLKLQIELCSAESSSIILVFCTVVSQIRTDMEAAMARVTEDKPVILVFMHHCHNPSHMTDITVQPSRSNIVQVAHCAFHETKGLLECKENEQVVKAVRSTLLRDYRNVDVQAEVPLTQSEIEQQPVAAQNANRPIMTNEVPRTGTKPMTEERESDQRTIVPAKGHSTGPSGGTSFLSKTGRFFSKSNWNISSDSVKSSTGISRLNPNPNRVNSSSLVKVHVLVAGETFQAHETFIQKLKLQIERHSAESCNIILVFCPVVSQIGTDMEAAMARVTEDKPVILVFMHHCHNPSHMTNTTVQPTRSNIEQVVHCAFHETTGLLRCQENEQAVADVQAMLMKHK